MLPAKEIRVLIPQTCEQVPIHSTRSLAYVIKDLGRGCLSPRWNNTTGLLRRGRPEVQSQRKRSDGGSRCLSDAGPGATEWNAGKGKEVDSPWSQGSAALQTQDVSPGRQVPLEPGGDIFVSLWHEVCGDCFSSNRR